MKLHNFKWLNLFTLLASVFFIWICATVIQSLYFGVDPTDESFYIAIPYHYILGGRPFFDEYSISQGVSLLLYPFFKIFYALQGNTDGIVLYARYLHFTFSLLIALVIFLMLRRIISTPIAIIIATICVTFVPFNIHGLSYNTLSMGFLTLSLFLNFYAINYKQIIAMAFAGVFLALVSVTYPPLILIILVNMIIFWLLMEKSLRLKFLLAYSIGLILGGSWFLVLLIQVGFDQLLLTLKFCASLGVQGGGTEKLIGIFTRGWKEIPHKIGVLFCAIIYLNIKFIPVSKNLQTILKILMVILAFYFLRSTEGMRYIRFIVLLVPFLFINIKDEPYIKNLLLFVWTPSVFAGFITSWSSSNGIDNFVIGGFPAALIAIIFLAVFLNKHFDVLIRSNLNKIVLIMLILIWAIAYPLKVSNSKYVYGDKPRAQLQYKIPSGVFAGIYTTQANKIFYLQLAEDLKKYAGSKHGILFFNTFPAGYLLTNIIPNANTAWLAPSQLYPHFDRQATLDYYQKNHSMPDVVVQILNAEQAPNQSYWYDYSLTPNDPIVQMLKLYKLDKTTSHYKIYIKSQ